MLRLDLELPRVSRASTQRHSTEKIRNREGNADSYEKTYASVSMYSLPSVVINRKTQGDPVKLTAVGKLPERKLAGVFLKKKYLFPGSFHRRLLQKSSSASYGHNTRSGWCSFLILPRKQGEELFIGSVSAFQYLAHGGCESLDLVPLFCLEPVFPCCREDLDAGS